ncbi:polysaccharide deacetylase family protein [Sphingobium sp.]|uniref:polysaccharide deacetylase family protein n=1 Tax=Sphingobium sp. TaxID=1912891 RepID=UPI002C847B2B|nr:polysaccharide deacetylase family protein [Sphingobium sp.]HUD95873.1 polysaccharide deacetylase family protein [Sphingobium sp.]
MTLDPSYLDYPRRQRGMDHDLYPWSNVFARAPLAWPEGRSVAVPIVVSLEWFPILPNDKPFRAPGHMQTAYPDYRHYTSREYGSRVGIYRLLDAFAAAGVRVSVATNSAIGERYPSLVADIVAAGHEIVAHSTDMNGTIASGLPEEDECAIILQSLDSLQQATGTRPRGWLSIARSQSFNTPRLLAEAGVEFMLDWVNDELPYRMTTPAGPIVNLPLNHELSDRQIITVQQNSADSYAQQMRDAFDWLTAEATATGAARMLPLHLTPYIMALPYRIDALEALLQWITNRPEAWVAPAGEVVNAAAL